MSRPNHLSIVGSKRWGSSLLVNALNLHPQVLISHQSDIVSILYQVMEGYPRPFSCLSAR
jgi:hypothetical protein